MNIEQTAAVVAKVQLIDNREVNELVLAEWHDVIGHLDFDDAIEAVRVHRRTSTAYLVPAHIVAGAEEVYVERRERFGACLLCQQPHREATRFLALCPACSRVAGLEDLAGRRHHPHLQLPGAIDYREEARIHEVVGQRYAARRQAELGQLGELGRG